MIQDRSFTRDGQLFYFKSWMPEFFGNVALVNSKVWPRLTVEPRKYRFRFLNASNARFYDLKLFESDASGQPPIDFSAYAGRGDAAEPGAETAGMPPVFTADPRPVSLSCFPDPGAGSQSVRFALPAAGRVDLEIFSVSGRRVRTLAGGEFRAGE